MFNLDEKHFFHPPVNDDHRHFPPEKRPYTMTEEMEHTMREMRNTIDRLMKFEKRLGEKVEDMLKHLTSDNVIFKNTFAESYNQFLREVKNEVNIFEGNVDSSILLFKQTIESDYAHLSEDCKSQILDYYNEFVDKLGAYKEQLNTTYDEFRTAIESRLVQYNTNYLDTFNTFVGNINSKLTTMEKKFNSDYNEFVEQVSTSVNNFKTEWTRTIDARLDVQDGTISDAVLFMKTNLASSVEAKVQEMYANGEFATLVEGQVFTDFNNRLSNIESSVTVPTERTGNALQTAVNKGGVIDLGGEMYPITTTLLVKDNTTIRNGIIYSTMGIANLVLVLGTKTTPRCKITFENVKFFGSPTEHTYGGILAEDCEEVIIRGCEFKDFHSDTQTAYGVHFKRCKNSVISDCAITNIEATPNGTIGDSAGASRGILLTDTTDTVIERCVLDSIVSTEDGDGIHVASSVNTYQEFDGHVVIRDCVFKNVARSAIKIQQSGVLIENNSFASTNLLEYGVRTYSSNVTIRNNTFNGCMKQPIFIGSNRGTLYENFVIDGNAFKGEYVDYQGCVNTGDEISVKNLKVVNNTADLSENIYFVYLRGWCTNCCVENNTVEKANCVLYFRRPSDDISELGKNKNISVANNTGSCYWYIARFDECSDVYIGIVVVGNSFEYLVEQSAMYRYSAYIQERMYQYHPVVKNNHVRCITGVSIYDGYIKRDVLSNRPTYRVNVGDMFYCTEDEKVYVCIEPAQYSDGEKWADAEWKALQ